MKTKTNLKTLLAISVFSVATVCGVVTGSTIYVDADAAPGGYGTSWADAYRYLQDALARAESGDEIWVAEGTYKPDQGRPGGNVTPRDRMATFHLTDGVTIYGGFAGGESNVYERDWTSNVTILSGDLNGDDSGFTNNDENSYHVVTITDSGGAGDLIGLNGFTIIGGNANGSSPYNGGGGMYNYSSYGAIVYGCTFTSNSGARSGGMWNLYSYSTVESCTFTGNSGVRGGGMHNENSYTEVSDCTFTGNSADDGGGMCNDGEMLINYPASPKVTGCSFTSNSADNGGGMFNRDSSPITTDCSFTGNSASLGGGMCNLSSSNPTLSSCIFSENSATESGGGIFNYNSSSPTMTNCSFNANSAGTGGGLCNYYNNNPILTNCTFTDNLAEDFGGGTYDLYICSPTMTNCKFSGNSANNTGGAMCVSYSCILTLTNCSFAQNSAPNGTALACNDPQGWEPPSTIEVTNCILWDGGSEIWNNDDSTITINYSDVEGGWMGPGGNNINADPLFVDGVHLLPGSPCIDAGDNDAVPADITTDLDGNGRVNNIVDMGAYECWGLCPPGWDIDEDGIENWIDTEPEDYSNGFADAATTFGEILERGDQILTIMDEPDPHGIRVTTDPLGLATPAIVSFCGGTTNLTFGAGVDMVVNGCSVEIKVISGMVEIAFVAADGTVATTSLDAGNSLEFDSDKFSITAPPTNEDIVVIKVDGEIYTLAPGETKTFATIDVDPDTLNLRSNEKWITCYIELPEGRDVADIDVGTIELNGVQAQSNPTDIGDHDLDGVADLMVKFDKAAVQATVEVGDDVLIIVTGELSEGTVFEGHDTIRVID